MRQPTEPEARLLNRVENGGWRTTLSLLKEAVGIIWSNESPRIIDDFTDHGVVHSERVARFAVQLLAANQGRDLSEEEAFLLLSGVFLHDIGMQCDVLKFPEIKERAEELGAEFDIEFSAETASGYSLDEQKAIRGNHQYLAAAWIDRAYQTGDTVFGPAVKRVPSRLIRDLIDICMFHTKLDITDCPHTSRLDPQIRTQLVAASSLAIGQRLLKGPGNSQATQH